MIWNIIVLIVIGLVAGLIARAVIPGKQDLGSYVAVTGRRGSRAL